MLRVQFKMKSVWTFIVFEYFAISTYGENTTFSVNDVNYQYLTPHESDVQPQKYNDDPGEPLFLTPLIQTGQLDMAKNLSLVGPLNGTNVVSYSGLLTVNPKFNSTMFFWYFLAQNNPTSAPVMLWLQGGPGGSDQYGLFYETGPFFVDKGLKLQPRQYSWNKNFNMLFIDNPVGTGYSFTQSDDGYARNETTVSNDLYEALSQFFTLFEEHQTNEFYLAGESYAGKYIPSIAYKIDEANHAAERKINLKGMAIGNGLIDPLTMNNYGDYLFQLGLIDDQIHLVFLQNQAKLVEYIEKGEMLEAFKIFDYLMNGDFCNQSLFKNVTGMSFYYNYLYTKDNIDNGYSEILMETSAMRRAIHVGNLTNNNGSKVESFFLEDFMNSTKPLVEQLLNKGYKTMLYSGQLDMIVPYVFTQRMINTLTWDHSSEFRNTERVIWKVDSKDNEVAGFAKQLDNLSLVLIRDAGHIAPFDQPRAAFDMISRFVFGKPFGYSAEQLYDIVSRVEDYEHFLPWCKKSSVTARRQGHITAQLVVGFPPITESYTSSVTLIRPHLVKAECFDGKLFNSLVTEWRFGPGIAGDNVSRTCKLDFRATFEFRSAFHSRLATTFLNEVVHKMTSAFIERAEKCYGRGLIKTKQLP